jgi:hypothetical protein
MPLKLIEMESDKMDLLITGDLLMDGSKLSVLLESIKFKLDKVIINSLIYGQLINSLNSKKSKKKLKED